MKTEILWNTDKTRNFLEDLKAFAMSLDFYQKTYHLDKLDENDYLLIENGIYRILSEPKDGCFECPVCGKKEFSVLEGEFQGKSAVGLACLECETYGAVFPGGM